MAGFIGNTPTSTNISGSDIADDSIESADIKAGTIVDSDINASAAIATSKVSGAVTSIASHGLGTSATVDTGTSANQIVKLDGNAKIPAVDGSQLTNISGYDDATIKSDILKLAISQAVDGNRVAYNLSDSFIDGFEDDSGITTETNVDRDTTGEYVSSKPNATGTLISDPQTASSSRSSVSGVIVYEDANTANTIGTDLKIYFSANNGSNWTEASSYATAVTYSGDKKLVTLGNTSVTAGTQIKLKAEWANQTLIGTAKTVTAVDNAHHDNGQAKFGSTSLYCDGTNDSIEVGDVNDFAFTGDYTVEFWVYFNGTPSNNTHFAGQGTDSASTYAFFFRCDSSGNFSAGTSNGSTQRLITSSTNMSNAWHHVALVKNGTSMKLYINGTSEGTPLTHSDSVQNVSYPFEFGGGNNSSSHVNAWFDEIRISSVARYTGNFTAPTSVFESDANTVVLIHCDGADGTNTFTDSSQISGKEAKLHGWAVNY